MFDEYLEPTHVERPISPSLAVSVSVTSAGTPSSTTIDQDAPSPSHSPSSSALQSPSLHQGVAAESTLMENNPFAPVDNDPFINVFAPEPSFEASSSGDLSSAESPYVTQTLQHLRKWSKDHPLDNIIGNPSRPVSTRKQLATDALWCLYNSVILWYWTQAYSKHMTGNCSKLKNFVEKFTGSVRFGNDHLGAIMGYEDYVIGDSVISRVYYVEGLGHTLISRRSRQISSKADIWIFVGYAPRYEGAINLQQENSSIMETIPLSHSNEMHQSMAPVRISSGPEPFIMTPGQLKSGLAPTDKVMEMLFQPMFNEHLEQSRVNEPIPSATEIKTLKLFQHQVHLCLHDYVKMHRDKCFIVYIRYSFHPGPTSRKCKEPNHEDTPIDHDVLHPQKKHKPLITGDPGSAQSIHLVMLIQTNPTTLNYPPDHLRRWTKDHPLDNIVGNPSCPISTRKQLASDALWCCFHTELSKVEPKNFKMAMMKIAGFKPCKLKFTNLIRH
ncbi:hypothetical protein Tco_0580513 [Tanacetum coccineum]